MGASLDGIDDDALLSVFHLLPIQDILAVRQTCTRLAAVSRLPAVWVHAFYTQVLAHGLPCPEYPPMHALPDHALEQRCRRALHLARFWSAARTDVIGKVSSRGPFTFAASAGLAIADVRFLPGRGGQWLATVSKGIWSTFTLWKLGDGCNKEREAGGEWRAPKKVAQWSSRGAIFRGFAVNEDPEGDALVAISVTNGNKHSVELVALRPADDDSAQQTLVSIKTIATSYIAVALSGNLLACADGVRDTLVLDWRTGASVTLRSMPPAHGPGPPGLLSNRCLQVLFLPGYILVVRARALDLFAFPMLYVPPAPPFPTADQASVLLDICNEPYGPIGTHALGWVDHVSVVPQTSPLDMHVGAPPLTILYRAKSDDPWDADTHAIGALVLHPRPSFDPHPPSGLLPTSTPSIPFSSTSPPCPYEFPPLPARTDPGHAARAGGSPPPGSPLLDLLPARGALRCRALAPGRAGSALLVRPVREPGAAGLVVPGATPTPATVIGARGGASVVREVLLGVVVPGSALAAADDDGKDEGGKWEGRKRAEKVGVGARVVLANEGAPWCCVDYDEAAGVVVLGAGDGLVTVLVL